MNRSGSFSLADVLARREPFEGLETLGEVVGSHEVREVSSKLVMGFVVEALDGRVLDGAVHPQNLTVGHGCFDLVRR